MYKVYDSGDDKLVANCDTQLDVYEWFQNNVPCSRASEELWLGTFWQKGDTVRIGEEVFERAKLDWTSETFDQHEYDYAEFIQFDYSVRATIINLENIRNGTLVSKEPVPCCGYYVCVE